MRLVRLPTIRSKHLETVIHTLLSTAHALTQRYDIVHYHALGPALFSFMPRLLGDKTAVTVQGLDWQRKKWGRLASAVLRLGEERPYGFRTERWWFRGRCNNVIARYTESKRFMFPMAECSGSAASRTRFWSGVWSPANTFCFWAIFAGEGLPFAGARHLSRSRPM